jgi:hypothetical protein
LHPFIQIIKPVTMKTLSFLLFCVSTTVFGQLSVADVRNLNSTYKIGSYSYHEEFIGHKGYGAPVIQTADGGGAAFGGWADEKGSCGLLVKVDKNGKEQWKKIVRPQFDEMETQSVVEDKEGNLYVYLLSYDYKRYRGGTERIVCYTKAGTLIWDKAIGTHELMNSPTVSYIRALPDGRVEMRGHIVVDKPEEGKDPKYRYWEGWINNKGVLTQKNGEVIDWAKDEWQKKFKPE